jgi:antitoxin component YwqK of YwqJK toxin-antitoxin module
MNFFCIRTVFQPGVSRIFPGYFFSFVFIILSCNHVNEKKEIKQEPRIAKTIPAKYINSDDSGFIRHQDTVFYRGNYFTGYRFSLYPNSDTAFTGGYFNGVEEGTHKRWYPGKQLNEERFYVNGKKEGMHRGWWSDGKPKIQFNCYNDEYEGEFIEWYPSGLTGKKFHYVNGKEEGSQRLWWDNGAVRANYVVRNGKKYGLIGLKICDNPYDSVIKK